MDESFCWQDKLNIILVKSAAHFEYSKNTGMVANANYFHAALKNRKSPDKKYLFKTMTNLLTFALQCVGVEKPERKNQCGY